MTTDKGTLSSAGIQAIIYVGIALFAFCFTMVILSTVLGQNKKKPNKQQAKPVTNAPCAPASTPTEELTDREIKLAREVIRLREEVKIRDEIIKTQETPEPYEETPFEKEHSVGTKPYEEIKNESVLPQPKKSSPPKPQKPAKIKMPKNTGGG